MSHRIVFDQLAIFFPVSVLKEACGSDLANTLNLYRDQLILLELGGDNNMTTRHPVSNREVTSRRWLATAAGADYEVIREVCGFAGYCEGGSMRWTGERHTTPESFIRRARTALSHAVSAEEARSMGFSMLATLAVDPTSERGQNWSRRLSVLDGLVPTSEEGWMRRYHFNLLADPRQAALFLSLRHADSSAIHNMISADGPRFGFKRPMREAA